MNLISMIFWRLCRINLIRLHNKVKKIRWRNNENRLVLVEERREDSLQRLQRTKNEIDEQKRLLKTQLQHRVRVLSEKLKKPNFIQTRDKIMFTIGVANACFSPLIG